MTTAPVEVWKSDPDRVEKAEAFLVEAHGHGKRGVEALQSHAVETNRWNGNRWDPETVHLAVQIERERNRRYDICGRCGANAAFSYFDTCARCGIRKHR